MSKPTIESTPTESDRFNTEARNKLIERADGTSPNAEVCHHQKRQKKPPSSPVTLRLTEEERLQVKLDAGDLSLSAHIRSCILNNGGVRKNTPVKNQRSLARALALLGDSRIANNLNQLAYQANTGSLLLDEETLAQIKEAHAHICTMRQALIAALGLREAR